MIKSNVRETDAKNIGYIKILFFVYIAIVIKVIIFKFPWEDLMAIAGTWEKNVIWEGFDTANFTLFKTIRMYINYSYMLNSFENLVGNVVVFIPFGFLLPYIKESCRNFLILLFHIFIFVLGIEVFQLFSAFGAFDVDDILLNCFGGILGWIAYIKWEAFSQNYRKKNLSDNNEDIK